jgi:Mn-dependent DtxR family transcriptional regulator
MIKLNRTNFTSVKECFNPDNGEAITIPMGFGINNLKLEDINKDNIKCPVFTCMLKENYKLFNKDSNINIQTYKLYEKYLFFISKVYKSYLYRLYNTSQQATNSREKDISYRGMEVLDGDIPTIFFSMKSESKTGLVANSLGMSKPSITKMINFMISYKFLELYSEEHTFVNYEKGETLNDKRCRHFIVSNQFYRRPVKYFFKNEKIVESLQKQTNKEIKDVLDNVDDVMNFEERLISDKAIQSYTFPTVERLQELAEKMVGNKEKDKYGRIYSFGIPQEWMSEDNGKKVTKKKANGDTFTYTVQGKLKENCPFVDINIHIYNYILMMNGTKTLKKRKKYYDAEGNVYYDRFYCFLSNIPRWIRGEILIHGEEIVEIDAQALHSKIVGKLYSDYTKQPIPEFLTGDSHTKVADLLGITRKEAKLIALSYWNSRIIYDSTVSSKKNAELFKRMDSFIKTDYPKLFEYLKDIKYYAKPIKIGKSSNSNMSVLLIDKEVRIMQDFLTNYGGFCCIYVYDAVYVKKSVYEFAKKGFENVINKHLRSL